MVIGVYEAKKRLSELLDRAAGGEEVVITKHGRPYARLGPAAQRKSQDEIEALMARVRRRRERMPMTSWSELKQDRDEGRRF